MRILYTLIVLICCVFTLHSQTAWTGAINNDWYNDANWTANAPATGDLAVILGSPNDPVINAVLNVDFAIQNFATITFNADVTNSGSIINFGAGTLINNGVFTNNSTQTVINDGQLLNNSLFINEGFLQGGNIGVIENIVGAVFYNHTGATVQNFAMIDNFGILNNDGAILNFSVFDNHGELFNYGTLNQGVTGVFNNYINAIFENNGLISNSGNINNNGGAFIINNQSVSNNSDGAISNNGIIENFEAFLNAGLIVNGGILSNDGTFTNDFGANFNNTGSIQNHSCATFKQFTVNPIGPNFINNGILYQIIGAGAVSVTSGSGVGFNNLNDFPAPTALCHALIAHLDHQGEVTITPQDIDNGSFANYCSIASMSLSEDHFTCSDIGTNIVILTVTDELGFTDFCAATVIVADNEAPLLTCPGNIYINLDAGECEATVSFNTPGATDNCGATVSKIDNTGLNSGDSFPAGIHTMVYQVSDGSNTVNCAFNINIIPFVDPDTDLVCGDLLELSLDGDCQAYIQADDILEGGPYACYESYIVDVNNTGSNFVGANNIGDTLTVSILDPVTGNSCWSLVHVSDYFPPTIICENTTITCLEDSSPDVTGYPWVFDGCDNNLIPTYQDVVNSGTVSVTTTTCSQINSSTDDAEEDESGGVNLTSGDLELVFDAGNMSNQTVGLKFNDLNIPQGVTITSAKIQFTAEATIGIEPCLLDFYGEDSDDAATFANSNNNISSRPKTSASVNWAPPEWDDTGDAGPEQLSPDLSALIQEIVDRSGYSAANSIAIIIEGIGKRTAFSFNGNADYAPELCITYETDCPDVDDDGICDNQPGNDCNGTIITRTWTVSDFSGNTSTCEQTINVIRPSLDDMVFPPNYNDIVEPSLDCSQADYTHPDYTGWPEIDGVEVQNQCDFYANFEDNIQPICDGSFKIVRSWEVHDWCTATVTYHTQFIKVLDKTPPGIVCPDDITISVGQNSCYGAVFIPQPTVSDNCSNQIAIDVVSSDGVFDGYLLTGLPIGYHWITYTATDACGNSSECTFEIRIVDEVIPIPICETVHTIGLTNNEPTLVPALTFDDGSYDNCSDLIYKARRKNSSACPGDDATVYGDYVPFYCCDVGTIVEVLLLVEDAAGNKHSCNVDVIVEDNLNPTIQCPADITLQCYDDYNDLSVTGEAIADDNCSAVVTYTQSGAVDNCGGGLIQRLWTATDPGGRTASCVQKIYVLNNAPFFITDTDCSNSNIYDGIIWPCDYETPNCDAISDPSIAGEPIITEDGCDLVAYTYEDLVFPITPLACIKILRTWTVIDWCQYDQASGYGRWEYTQLIKILNTTAPVFITDCETQAFCSFEQDCGPAPIQLTAQAKDDCTLDADINYTFEIDIENDGSVNVIGSGNDASGEYPLGTHSIKWFAEDGCGNVSVCEYQFIIEDCKKPTPYCINGLAVNLMPNSGMVIVWAADFDQGSFDNCGVAELRIASPSQGPGQNTPPAPGSHSVTFDCWNEGTNSVDLWVGDINGNWDYCSTYIIVQDNQQVCNNGSATSQITGTIHNENGDFVQDVTVMIEGDMSGLPDPEVTGVEGIYAFPWLAVGQEYTIEPEKDMNPLNGVTTFDLVLVTKHILQAQILDSPYKLIAADINGSGSVTAFDIVMLRRLILTIDDNFTSNTSWRFVDADFVFPNPSNPWATPFPEIFEVDDLGGNEIVDFVAVKIGDVNTTAVPNNLVGDSDDRNTENPLIFNVQDQNLKAGKTYHIDFTAEDFNNRLGYQFTLGFDEFKIKVESVEAGEVSDLNMDNFGMHRLESGIITTSWNLNATEQNNLTQNGTSVFRLEITALEDVVLSNVLEIISTYTKAEAYVESQEGNIEITDVNLVFKGRIENQFSNSFKLYPNQPNPFINETLIRFELPENTPLTLSIQDVSGKILKVIEGEYEAGYNEINILSNDLNGNGIFFYTLTTKNNQASGKMVLIQR